MIDMPPLLQTLLERARNYLLSFAENTAVDLLIVSSLLLILLLIVFRIRMLRLRRARSRLPLVIGGWGTRGKSGTERKKAALFYALGYNVVAKVTGSEAMFVHGAPGLPPADLMIYRPNEKASIWEQHRLTLWAADLGAEVFLWECMALRPDYAYILQKRWMHDDVSTLTNAVPDHENVQGPSGRHVAGVLSKFFPVNSTILTAEDQMLPLLTHEANLVDSTILPTQWWEPELLGADALARFPYHVHPNNMALVLKLAAVFGISHDFALKEIADWIVPDIGALKTFEVDYRARRLEFANGMAANDRMSCMSNWNRLGYPNHDSDLEPGVWIATVVNNRADRIPRSQEFARILVNDAIAHKHFLIGTNLHGFQGYFEQAVNNWLPNVSLSAAIRNSDAASSDPAELERLLTKAMNQELKRLKIEARSEASITAKLRIMLSSSCVTDSKVGSTCNQLAQTVMSGDLAERSARAEVEAALSKIIENQGIRAEILEQLKFDTQHHALILEFAQGPLKNCVAHPADSNALQTLDKAWRKLLKTLVKQKLVVIENPKTSGDEIIEILAQATPPGFRLRVMGMQNIKGTGLDFAYRWLSLGQVQQWIRQLESPDYQTRIQTIDALTAYDDYGILDAPLIEEALLRAKTTYGKHNVEITQKLDLALQRVRLVHEQKRRVLFHAKTPRHFQPLRNIVEQLLEYGDSKRRKRKADKIMRQLFRGAISHQAAAREIHELMKRQYGGWFGSSSLLP